MFLATYRKTGINEQQRERRNNEGETVFLNENEDMGNTGRES